MMQYKKRIIIAAVSIALLFAGMLVYRYLFTLYITSTNPNFSSISYQAPFIKLYFNKPLDAKSFDLEDPNNLFYKDKTTISSNQIDLLTNSNSFSVGKTVSFKIKIRSDDGKYTFNETLDFKVADIAYKDLPDDQQKVTMAIQDSKPDYYKDPILEKVPHSTLNYEIKPDFISDNELEGFVLDITVFLSNIDIKEGRDRAINRYYNQALAYIKSVKAKDKNYSVNLIVQEP